MITFIEVCAGAGGLSAGLIKAGCVPLLLNDNDKDCCATLRLNHPTVKVAHQGMESLDLSAYRGVDLLAGGVPCQSFSQAGGRKGLDDPRGNLMLQFGSLVDQVEPKMFLIENVKGLLSHEGGATLKAIVEHLRRGGKYEVGYQVLNSADYSVPQKRERVFIVGRRNDLGLTFEFPVKQATGKVLRDVLTDVPPSAGAKYPAEKVALFKLIPPGGCWVHLPEELQKSYLGNSYFSGGGKRGILHRLSMDKPCLTLLCSPSQKQTERCHPTEERPLTIREYARIQTFDDDYQFAGSVTSQYKQIGNAVPVELARQVAECVVFSLLEDHVESDQSQSNDRSEIHQEKQEHHQRIGGRRDGNIVG